MTVTGADRTGPAQALMDSGLPGTQFYAPQARILDEQGGAILIGDQPVNSDLVSVKVTQTHHGVSQVAITMNNQRHDAAGRPLAPMWKYNRMDAIKFGQRVRVEFRYGNHDWTQMILARITDVSFNFPSAGGAQLTLQGEDLLSLLKTKPEEDKRYRDKSELEIITDSLTRSSSGLSLLPTDLEIFPETLRTITHRQSQTYLQFIESLAERMDYEVFVDSENPTQMHFRPARSMDSFNRIIDLTWNRDLVEFRPKFKVWDIFTDVTVKGRHPRLRRRFRETANADDIAADLHAIPGGDMPMNAVAARNRFFANENRAENNSHSETVTNLDPQRARKKAQALMRKRAREFLTAEVSTIGFSGIAPGIHININNLSAPFDGIYYVTKAVHSIDGGGYKTQCSLRRPGMLNPDAYPGV